MARESLSVAQCARALTLLPRRAGLGIFGPQEPGIYKLPRHAEFGNCLVEVRAPDRAPETTSWVQIHSAAMEILVGCQYRGMTGGRMEVQDSGTIQVRFIDVGQL